MFGRSLVGGVKRTTQRLRAHQEMLGVQTVEWGLYIYYDRARFQADRASKDRNGMVHIGLRGWLEVEIPDRSTCCWVPPRGDTHQHFDFSAPNVASSLIPDNSRPEWSGVFILPWAASTWMKAAGLPAEAGAPETEHRRRGYLLCNDCTASMTSCTRRRLLRPERGWLGPAGSCKA